MLDMLQDITVSISVWSFIICQAYNQDSYYCLMHIEHIASVTTAFRIVY